MFWQGCGQNRGEDADTQRAMAAAGSQSPTEWMLMSLEWEGRNESLMQNIFPLKGNTHSMNLKKDIG